MTKTRGMVCLGDQLHLTEGMTGAPAQQPSNPTAAALVLPSAPLTARAFSPQGFPLPLLTPSSTSCSSLLTWQPASQFPP